MYYTDLLTRIKMDDKDILNIYQRGSRVYGTVHKESDWDFYIICNRKTQDEYSDNLINVHFYTPIEFDKKLNDHDIAAIECFFLPDHFIWKENLKFSFEVNKSKLRNSLSHKAEHSWVKSKKKLTVEVDYDLKVGKKSLFHAIRILHFGIQLATEGKITNYQECNQLFNDVWYNFNSWPELFEHYNKQYKQLKSQFKLVAPK